MTSVLHAFCIQSRQINARMCYLFSFLCLEHFQQTCFTDRPFSPFACSVSAIENLLPHRRRSSLYCKSATAQALPSRYRKDLLLNSVFFAFSSLTRLARIDAYSFCQHQSAMHPETNAHVNVDEDVGRTHSSILGGFGLATLERHSVTLVLETLRGDETLDTGCFGVGFLAFALGLDFAADDEFADLAIRTNDQQSTRTPLSQHCQRTTTRRKSDRAQQEGETEHSHHHPCPSQRTCES